MCRKNQSTVSHSKSSFTYTVWFFSFVNLCYNLNFLFLLCVYFLPPIDLVGEPSERRWRGKLTSITFDHQRFHHFPWYSNWDGLTLTPKLMSFIFFFFCSLISYVFTHLFTTLLLLLLGCAYMVGRANYKA